MTWVGGNKKVPAMIDLSDRPGSAARAVRHFEPWVYPSDLTTRVTTENGLTLQMRPIRPDDADILQRFHAQLTPDSVFRRYFSLHPELSDEELVHLTTVDYVDRLAFIIIVRGALVAVGRYDRIPDTTRAEVAFLVDDAYQHQGLGILLLDHLADAAWDRGITTFVAETQADNRSMMHVFKESGFTVSARLEDEIILVRFPIEPTDESRARRAERARRWATSREAALR